MTPLCCSAGLPGLLLHLMTNSPSFTSVIDLATFLLTSVTANGDFALDLALAEAALEPVKLPCWFQ